MLPGHLGGDARGRPRARSREIAGVEARGYLDLDAHARRASRSTRSRSCRPRRRTRATSRPRPRAGPRTRCARSRSCWGAPDARRARGALRRRLRGARSPARTRTASGRSRCPPSRRCTRARSRRRRAASRCSWSRRRAGCGSLGDSLPHPISAAPGAAARRRRACATSRSRRATRGAASSRVRFRYETDGARLRRGGAARRTASASRAAPRYATRRAPRARVWCRRRTTGYASPTPSAASPSPDPLTRLVADFVDALRSGHAGTQQGRDPRSACRLLVGDRGGLRTRGDPVTESIHDFTRQAAAALAARARGGLRALAPRAGARARARGGPIPSRRRSAPISINLDLTTACNYRCDHCIDWDILNTKHRHDEETLRSSICTMVERGLRSVILIGGGEPTIYPGFADFVRFLKDLELQVAVVSNGSRGDVLLEIADVLDAARLGAALARRGQQRAVPRHAQAGEALAHARRDLRVDPAHQGSATRASRSASRTSSCGRARRATSVAIHENIHEIVMATERARRFGLRLHRAEAGARARRRAAPR